jgi:hypothetical protein
MYMLFLTNAPQSTLFRVKSMLRIILLIYILFINMLNIFENNALWKI